MTLTEKTTIILDLIVATEDELDETTDTEEREQLIVKIEAYRDMHAKLVGYQKVRSN